MMRAGEAEPPRHVRSGRRGEGEPDEERDGDAQEDGRAPVEAERDDVLGAPGVEGLTITAEKPARSAP